MSPDEFLGFCLACAKAHQPKPPGRKLSPREEIGIFDNTPRGLTGRDRSLGSSRSYPDYLRVRFAAFAAGDELTAADLAELISAHSTPGGPGPENGGDLSQLLMLLHTQRPKEESALVRRLAQLPEHIVLERWYQERAELEPWVAGPELERWVAHARERDAAARRAAWEDRFQSSYGAALAALEADPDDEDALRAVEHVHEQLVDRHTGVSMHLRGDGPRESLALGNLELPAAPRDVGDLDGRDAAALLPVVTRIAEADLGASQTEVLKHFLEALVRAVGCAWADYLETGVRRDLEPIVTTNSEGTRAGYLEGQGISGSAVFLPEWYFPRCVGTNLLKADPRQSEVHADEYAEYPSDFWLFPVFDHGEMIGAFRVVLRNSDLRACGVPWSPLVLRELHDVAMWFEATVVPRLVARPSAQRPLTEGLHLDVAKSLREECQLGWVPESTLAHFLAHVTSVSHRRVERNSLGCSLGVFPASIAETLVDEYGPYNPAGEMRFGGRRSDVEVAAQKYQSVDPALGLFIFDEAGRGYGVVRTPENDPKWPTRLSKDHDPGLVLQLERGQDCVRLFTTGRVVADYYLSDSTGVWTLRRYQMIEREVEAKVHGTTAVPNMEFLREVIGRAFELSHQRIGAMLILGKELDPELVTQSEPLRRVLFTGTGSRVFVDIARRDGAVHITPTKKIVANGVLVQAKRMEGGRRSVGGGRHAAAQSFSGESPDHIVIVVSENRTISVLMGGHYIIERA